MKNRVIGSSLKPILVSVGIIVAGLKPIVAGVEIKVIYFRAC
jgi:hypothetical protein